MPSLISHFSVPLAIAAVLSLASGASSDEAIAIDDVGGFHVGGKAVVLEGMPIEEQTFTNGMKPIKVDPNGTFVTGQMYVGYVKLAEPVSDYPILMWHGGGMTGATWQDKPDGGAGWEKYFLKSGYSTYVSDAVERGRSSWSQFPEIYSSDPVFRTLEDAWGAFRIGPEGGWNADPAKRDAFANTEFPTEAFVQFSKQFVPRWLTNDDAIQAAYDELVSMVCPCIVMAHSQGGNFAYNAALNNPELVRAVVLIEPSGAPNPGNADAAKLREIPHLVVWGDNIAQHPVWPRLTEASRNWHDAINDAGGHFDWLDLPVAGITGNSHFPMMDKNSDDIAALMVGWIQATVN